MIAAKRRVGDYLRHTVGVDSSAKPTLEWRFDQAALDHEAATDGWYCLLTNLGLAEADAGEVLVRYKVKVVERRYGNFKGPIAVAPNPSKSNRRIEALLRQVKVNGSRSSRTLCTAISANGPPRPFRVTVARGPLAASFLHPDLSRSTSTTKLRKNLPHSFQHDRLIMPPTVRVIIRQKLLHRFQFLLSTASTSFSVCA